MGRIRHAVADWATDGLRVAITNALYPERRSSEPRVGGAFMAGSAIFRGWSTERAVKEGYKASYILYAVASDLADCIRQVPWQLKKRTSAGDEIVDNHALVEMIRSPNTETTYGALNEGHDIFKSLAGDAYERWVEVGDGNIDVWRLRPDRVRIVPDKRGHILRYEYHVGGEPDKFKPEEIVHMKFFNPGDDHHGMAPLQAAALLVDTSNAGLVWNSNAMKNRGRPDMVMAPKEHLTPEKHKTLLDLLTKRITGPENARSISIPSEPMEILQLSLSPVEMDFLQSFLTYEVGVCKVFHVHPEAIGALGATFENKEWAIRDKWQGPVKSRLSEMRAARNHRFRLPYGTVDPQVARVGDIFLDYDLSQTPLADYQQGKALDRAKTAWSCGMPWNAAAQTFGVGSPPIDGGDVGYIPVTLLPIVSAPSEGRSSRAINPSSGGQMRAHYQEISRKREGWVRGVVIKVGDVFAEQGERVAASVRNGKIDTDKVIDSSRQAWSTLITAVSRAVIEDFGEQVASDLNPGRVGGASISARATEGLSDDRRETPAGYEFDPWSSDIEHWVTTQTAEHVASIQATTKAAVRKVVLDGIDAGESMDKIARRVREQFALWEEADIGVYRSMMIARTEVHTASSYAMHESARQSGVVNQKSWLDAGDERVRESHMGNTAEGWIGFGEAYSNGAAHPGDGPDVIGCRCVEMYRTG